MQLFLSIFAFDGLNWKQDEAASEQSFWLGLDLKLDILLIEMDISEKL